MKNKIICIAFFLLAGLVVKSQQRINPGSTSQWVKLCEEWLIENKKL